MGISKVLFRLKSKRDFLQTVWWFEQRSLSINPFIHCMFVFIKGADRQYSMCACLLLSKQCNHWAVWEVLPSALSSRSCEFCMLDPNCGFCYRENGTSVYDSSCVPVNQLSTDHAAWGRWDTDALCVCVWQRVNKNLTSVTGQTYILFPFKGILSLLQLKAGKCTLFQLL